MTLQITMMMYSGKPDPQWTIDGREEEEFRRLIDSPAFDTARPPIPWKMGYRGFIVVDLSIPDQPLLRVRDRSTASFAFWGAPEVEQFLLRTAPADESPLPPDTRFFRPPAIETPPEARAPRAWFASRAVEAPNWIPGVTPGFSGDPKWITPPHQMNNNCMNYAVDRQQTAFGQPGVGHISTGGDNRPFLPPSACGFLAGLLADGCLRTRHPRDRDLGVGEGHYACLVLKPYQDMHYYRQDSNGWWSHKLGTGVPTNLDASGQPIDDPRFCDRGPYTIFVAFFTVPPGARFGNAWD